MLSVEVVETSIPLLIGLNAMETAETQLDFRNHMAKFFDQEVNMCKVGTGHFCINLISKNVETH